MNTPTSLPPPLTRVQLTTELFREFRRKRWRTKDWGWLNPVFERGKLDDATVARCALVPGGGRSRDRIKLARLLKSMSVAERAELRRAVRQLKASDRTSKIYRRLYNDTLMAVSDLANLELILHEKNKHLSGVLMNLAPTAREFLVNLIVVRLIVNITRMLDGAVSAGKETGSVEALIVSLERDGFVVLGSRLRRLLGRRESKSHKASRLRATAGRIVRARHKDIAHLDARAIVDNRKRPSTTFAVHRRTIEGIASILEDISSVVFNEGVRLTHLGNADIAMRELLQALDKVPS